MITIDYCADGEPISDFNYKDWLYGEYGVKNLLVVCKDKNLHLNFQVSTSLPIHAVRAAIHKGEIDPKDIEFLFENRILKPDKNGRISDWPEGFCDAEINEMERLLDWDCKE